MAAGHSLHVGGGFNRGQENFTKFHFFAGLGFLSFPDFLLGQDAATNGTPFSNVFLSLDLPGLFDRYFRLWEYNTYAQDDIKLTSRLTVNLGLRFEHLGGLGDELGRNGSFDIARADPNPPASGSLAGFVVPDNFRGTVPPGVTKLDNNLGYRGDGQNTWNPRIGFAWQMPPSRQVVLRGAYGVYHQRVTGQPLVDRQVVNVDLIKIALRDNQRYLPPSVKDRLVLQVTPPIPFGVDFAEQSAILPRRFP